MKNAREIIKKFISNLNVGRKDIQVNALDIYQASSPTEEQGEPILDEKGNPTGFYARDSRLRVLQGDNGRRVVTFKLHD